MIQISLAAARVNADLSQQEASEKLNVTPKTLRGYEHGRVVIPSDKLRLAAELYNIPSDMIRLKVLVDGEYDEKNLDITTV